VGTLNFAKYDLYFLCAFFNRLFLCLCAGMIISIFGYHCSELFDKEIINLFHIFFGLQFANDLCQKADLKMSLFYIFCLGFLSKALPTMCNSKLHWDKHLGKFVTLVGEMEKKQAQMECVIKVISQLD